jgi:hypothetical protein
MRLTYLQLPIFAGTTSYGVYVCWAHFQSFAVCFYVFFAIFWGLAKCFSWPRPEWFAATRVGALKEEWGRSNLGHDYSSGDPVSKLSTNLKPRAYFTSAIFCEQTDRLCNSVADGLVTKTVLAVIGAFFSAVLIAPQHSPSTGLDGVLRVTAITSPMLLSIIWDWSRIERQRYLNKEAPAPHV